MKLLETDQLVSNSIYDKKNFGMYMYMYLWYQLIY